MWVWQELSVENEKSAPELLWRELPRERTLYDVFGVAPNASGLEIGKRYRVLARALHPDGRKEHAAQAHEEMAELNAAFEVLRDAGRRASYDREHGFC